MELAQRKNHRLKDFDYGEYGYYYVTVCTYNREESLCNAVGSGALSAPSFVPTEIGEKVIECWNNIAKLNENIEVDKFVLMPNHIHGIIIIKNTKGIEKCKKQFAFQVMEQRDRRSLQGLMRDFKSVTTRWYKRLCGATTSLWQNSFYDEVIRNQQHYDDVWEYIDGNPLAWEQDELN